MGSLFVLLFLSVTFQQVFSYTLISEPSVRWPTEYHFDAEEIDLSTPILKPFEIWYSTKFNRSRISMYGNTLSRYYYGMYYDEEGNEHDSKVYMVHPQVAEDDSRTEVKCEMWPSWGDQEDFLPSLEEFHYSGDQQHDGKQVQVWTRTEIELATEKTEETLLVLILKDDLGIPLHHYKNKFNLKEGTLESDIVINYYNYNDKVKLDDLDPTEQHNCDSWDEFPRDLDTAITRLHPGIASDVDMAFHRYKRHHDKEYRAEEHEFRKAVFKSNWQLVVEHNKKKLSYQLGLNQFADKTMEELAYLSGVKRPDGPIKGTHKFPLSEKEVEDIVAEIPENFDLRMEGVITPVQNQASCGSCWAFAAAATVEGVVARANGGRLLDLSEQSLVDCAWQFRSHGCGGTEAIDAVYEYLMKHGIPTVREYGPYLAEDGFCNISNMTELYNIKGFVGVTKNSPNALKAAVYKYGPITIGVEVTRHMSLYKSGILYDVACEPGAMNHAVTLVGYGVRDGDQYWVIKNSWGESWGEGGYILLAANKNNCNVMNSPYYPLI